MRVSIYHRFFIQFVCNPRTARIGSKYYEVPSWYDYVYLSLFMSLKDRTVSLLRWSEKYTKTDMVYLAQSNFWLQAISIFVSFASFLLYIVFGHVLSKEVYGTYQYLLSIGAIVGAFTLTGMSTAVTRAVARGYEGTFRESIRVQLLWSIIPLLGSWAFGGYYLLHANATLGWGLVLIGIFVPFNSTFNTYGAYLLAKKDFRRAFLYNLFNNAPYYISVALIAVSLPVALALLAANLISQAIGFFIAYKKTLAVYQPNENRDPEAMSYGKQLSFINALTTVIAQVDSILVFHFLGAAELALYSFSTAIPDRLGIFKNIAAAAFPKFANKTHEDIRTSLIHKLLLSIVVALGIALLYDIFAHSFFLLFFPLYLSAVPYTQAYAFIIAATFGSLFTTALTAHSRVKALYIYNILAPLFLLACEIVGILLGGLWGLIIARVVGAFFSSLLTLGLFWFSV
jgi:O-antigen/teichoic acid export membrane protein